MTDYKNSSSLNYKYMNNCFMLMLEDKGFCFNHHGYLRFAGHQTLTWPSVYCIIVEAVPFLPEASLFPVPRQRSCLSVWPKVVHILVTDSL